MAAFDAVRDELTQLFERFKQEAHELLTKVEGQLGEDVGQVVTDLTPTADARPLPEPTNSEQQQ